MEAVLIIAYLIIAYLIIAYLIIAYHVGEVGHLPWVVALDEAAFFGRWVLGDVRHASLRSASARCCHRRGPVRVVGCVMIVVTAPDANTDASWYMCVMHWVFDELVEMVSIGCLHCVFVCLLLRKEGERRRANFQGGGSQN
jgi:hypothetical protein